MEKYRPKKQTNKALTSKKVNGVTDINGVKYWQIFDIKLFGRNNSRVLNVLEKKLASGTKKYWIATVNPEFVMTAQKDEEFKKILSKTSLNVVDGIGLIWAQQMLRPNFQFSIFNFQLVKAIKIGIEVLRGKYKDQVTSGADLIIDLVKMAQKMDKKIFLLSGWGERAKKTAEFLMSNYQISNKNIQWCEGEPNVANNEVIKRINIFKPDILLVAYGMKKQEFWIDKNLKVIDVGLVMGVGRSFDYYSGELKRAPFWVRKTGLEWLYSLIKEPKRFKRQLVLPKFILKVLYN